MFTGLRKDPNGMIDLVRSITEFNMKKPNPLYERMIMSYRDQAANQTREAVGVKGLKPTPEPGPIFKELRAIRANQSEIEALLDALNTRLHSVTFDPPTICPVEVAPSSPVGEPMSMLRAELRTMVESQEKTMHFLRGLMDSIQL